MANGFTTIGTQDVNVLISAINQQLNTEMKAAESVYRKVCLVDSTSNAKLQHYPMNVTAYSIREQLAYQAATFSKPEVVDIFVGATDFRSPIQMASLGAFDDPYGIIERAAQDNLKSAMRQWEILLANLINGNGVWSADNQPFFGTHNSNPGVPGRATFSNVLTATPPNKAGFLKAFNTLQNVPGFDGRRLFPDLDMTREVVCVVPSLDMYVSLAEVLHAGMTAQPVGAGAAASTDTRLVNYAKNILVLPELQDPLFPDSYNTWYMICTGYATRPAFIMRDFKQPRFKYVPEGSWLDHQYMSHGFIVEAAGGAGFGLPHSVVKCLTF